MRSTGPIGGSTTTTTFSALTSRVSSQSDFRLLTILPTKPSVTSPGVIASMSRNSAAPILGSKTHLTSEF
jgi:hypothetical protein